MIVGFYILSFKVLTFKMNDEIKAILKAQLRLSLITPEEIQNWAIDTLEKFPDDYLALDICFLSTDDEILNYFEQLQTYIYDQYLTTKTIRGLLKDYIERYIDSINTPETLLPFFQNLLFFSSIIKDEPLLDLLDYYDDEFNLLFNKTIKLEQNLVFQSFAQDLKNLLVIKLN